MKRQRQSLPDYSNKSRHDYSAWCHGGFCLALGLISGASFAQDRDTMTGDWGGVRSNWKNRGINLRADYVSETASVVQGGEKQGTRYAQQIRFGADFDMSKLAGWASGTFHLTFNDRAGRGASTDLVGNRMPIQEVYSSQFFKLTELNYEQDLFNHKVNVRVGLMPLGNDFGALLVGCEFMNAAFCAHALSMSGNSGWGNYPNSRWGGRIKWSLTPNVDLRIGAWQVDAAYSTEAHAFSLHPSGSTGAIFPVEVDFHAPNGSLYPNDFKIGAYYDTDDAKRDGTSSEVNGRHGFYLIGNQRVWHEANDVQRGLTMAGEFMRSDKTTSQISYWYAAAAIYQGLLPGRDRDTLAFGWVRAVVNPALVHAYQYTHADTIQSDILGTLPNAESLLELSYGYRVNRWFTVRPDLQYLFDPGAFSYKHTPNAVAVGVQLKTTF